MLGFLLAATLAACGDNNARLLSSTDELTAFSFRMTSNPTLSADVTGSINGDTIAATVPFGTDKKTLVATFATTGATVTVAATAQVSGATANDFSAPVMYLVTAADGSMRTYTVTVSVATSSAKAITAYGFLSAHNAGLTADVAATINGAAIAVTVPFGTDVTALVASFSTSGASVTVGATSQVSDTTPNDFTLPVSYRVTAADGTTRDFTVIVTIAANTAKAITAYAFLSAHNPGLGADVNATINGTAIAATVPFGTTVTALVANFATTGASVTVGGTPQLSDTTANDFTSPVVYRVTAADGSTQDFTVTVTVAASPAKEITDYAFLSADNGGLGTDVTATINGTAIAATVPFGTNVSALIATFATTGASVRVGGTLQASGITANDFANPVVYTVTAADGSTQDFTVTVTIAPSPAKEITTYSFLSVDNPGLGADVTATINGNSIAATVPFGTNVSALFATFATTGVSVKVGGTLQASGITANDFASPVVYTVTAADGTTQDFTVTVTIAPSTAKEITSYQFLSAKNGGLGGDVIATINGTSIAATVPFGTTVTALIATFATSGDTVTVNGTAQDSGLTANDFTSPVTYRVKAADGSTKDFTVTVTIAVNSAAAITSYEFLSAKNAGKLDADVTATINGTSIAATVPFGTDVTALVATFATTGDTVKVASVVQDSGITANDFTLPVTYHVTAADGSTQDFTVTVTIAASPVKEITSYAFLSAKNAGKLDVDVAATINGTAIAATVPFGTTVTALVATFATSGDTVTVNGTTQDSGLTANDFTSPVIYRVKAADGSTKDFTVTVTIAPNTAKEITSFEFLSTKNPGNLSVDVSATINGTTIVATVPFGTTVTALVATFATSGDTVTVNGTTQDSGLTANDFTSPVTYRVKAADGSTKDFTVTLTIAVNTAKEITSFEFLSAKNAGKLNTDVVATINGTAIVATVPFGTDVTSLVATFDTSGDTVKVNGTLQDSGITPNDFTSQVTYHVTAADGSTKDFTVTVTIAQNTAKEITTYSFLSAKNGGNLPTDVIATISGTSITAIVPFGTQVTALVATFTKTGDSIAVAGTPQVSDTTANDFTSPVAYTVTAADNSTKIFTVTVIVALSPAKDITAYSFLSAKNSGKLSTDVIATITGTSITATVPFGTNVSALVATFTASTPTVKVAGVLQVSGTTPNDFSGSVDYQVTAADGTTKVFTVTLTIAPSPAKDITTFKFLSAGNAGLAGDVTATIAGTSISVTLPFGTPAATVRTLVATFTATGPTVKVGSTVQTSGMTANDFTSPVVYTVMAADSTTKAFTVTATVSATAITAFSFLVTNNQGLAVDTPGTITGTAISVDLPPPIGVTALVATVTSLGVPLTVAGAAQTSGVTPNDFTSPASYMATGVDGSTQVVTVTVNPTLVSFSFTGAAGNEVTRSSDGLSPGLATAPVMSRGPGVTPSGAQNTFSSSAWTTGATPDLPNDYYSFTVTPAAGKMMTLTHLALKNQRSAQGPATFSVRSSLDAFAADLVVSPTPPPVTLVRSDLALGAAFANRTTAVEFRIYGYAAVSAGGTWRLDDVELSGTITP